jgi:nucleoside-diphosphate-sugar epimerase
LLERGVEVHGVDASAEMVSKLREKPGGERIPVVVADFASADAGRTFALVVLAANTIFALPDQQAQVG